jgi:hypothetical protein
MILLELREASLFHAFTQFPFLWISKKQVIQYELFNWSLHSFTANYPRWQGGGGVGQETPGLPTGASTPGQGRFCRVSRKFLTRAETEVLHWVAQTRALR